MRRLTCLILATVLLAGLAWPAGNAAAETAPGTAGPAPVLIMPVAGQEPTGSGFTDMAGHWSSPWVGDWAGQGLVIGYPDGTFRPDAVISRAELAALVNRALGWSVPAALQEELFPGESLHWYDETIATAVYAGYLVPGPDGVAGLAPDEELTRGDLAVMLSAALRLGESSVDELSRFADGANVPAGQAPALAALVKAGYLYGFPDQTVQADLLTTRAQAVSLLARALGTMYRVSGEHGHATGDPEFIAGGASVAAPGTVTLRNLFITGDLYITAGASGATVRLVNVAVLGTLRVIAGAAVILDGSRAGALVVDAPAPAVVDIIATADALVGEAELRSATSLAESGLVGGDGFTELRLRQPADAAVDVAGDVTTVLLDGPGVAMRVDEGSVALCTVSERAGGASIDLLEGSRISELQLRARARVAGDGQVDLATVLAPNVEFTMLPGELVVAPDLVAIAGGQRYAGELVAVREYTFESGPSGWQAGYCDYPVEVAPEEWDLVAYVTGLPAEMGPGTGFLVQGNNHSDDLFMYLRRSFGPEEGLQPGSRYAAWVSVDLGTNAPAGAVGIGGAPGESVYVKVGAAEGEPLPVAGPDGNWVLSADKGQQSAGGADAVVVGDVAKAPVDEWSELYKLKTLGNLVRPVVFSTGEDGQGWVFVGTDSGFEGLTALYYVRINVRLTRTRVEAGL